MVDVVVPAVVVSLMVVVLVALQAVVEVEVHVHLQSLVVELVEVVMWRQSWWCWCFALRLLLLFHSRVSSSLRLGHDVREVLRAREPSGSGVASRDPSAQVVFRRRSLLVH